MHEKINGGRLPSVAALSYLGDACHTLYGRKMESAPSGNLDGGEKKGSKPSA